MNGGLPADETCEYLHQAEKLTPSPPSYLAIHVRHATTDCMYQFGEETIWLIR